MTAVTRPSDFAKSSSIACQVIQIKTPALHHCWRAGLLKLKKKRSEHGPVQMVMMMQGVPDHEVLVYQRHPTSRSALLPTH
jgi:hypothetical protein